MKDRTGEVWIEIRSGVFRTHIILYPVIHDRSADEFLHKSIISSSGRVWIGSLREFGRLEDDETMRRIL